MEVGEVGECEQLAGLLETGEMGRARANLMKIDKPALSRTRCHVNAT